MKRIPLLLALSLLLCLVSGCDFFRTLAGRPTSRDINERRAIIEQTQARRAALADSLEQARRDSVARVQKAVADSLHAIDTLTTIGKYHLASSYRNIPVSRLQSKYALVVGVFSNQDNAKRMLAKYSKEGFDGYVLHYRSSLMAVVVSPCSKIAEALEAYRKVRRLPFNSAQTWIIVKE